MPLKQMPLDIASKYRVHVGPEFDFTDYSYIESKCQRLMLFSCVLFFVFVFVIKIGIDVKKFR